MINDAFARRYLKDREAVGAHVRMSGQVREIVGVVGDVQQRAGFNGFGPLDALPSIYMPFAQFPDGGLRTVHGWFSTAWIVREARPGAVTEPVLRRTMAEVDPLLAVSAVRGVDEVRSAALARQRMLMTLVAALGGVALLLAAIGIHGLIASGVTERTREFGIRMAMGATAGQTIREAAMPGLLDGAGRPGCRVRRGDRRLRPDSQPAVGRAGRTIRSRSRSWSLTLLVVAVAASVLPALRVRRLDPVSLLRSE